VKSRRTFFITLFRVSADTSFWCAAQSRLSRVLSTEREAASGKLNEESKLVPNNFRFDLVGQERTQDGASYVLEVTPTEKSKVAWRGKVWVNGVDYAVVRTEGHPEKMPSWWTVESNFVSTYQKMDEIWIPARNVSDTRVRFGGHAHLVIDYGVCRSIANSDASATPPLSPGDSSIRSPEQLSK
jgi:hypothetical protein